MTSKPKSFYKGKAFSQGKYAFGTIWNMDDVDIDHLKKNEEKFDYVWLQKDKGEKSEKEHYHFLVVVSRKIKIGPLQKLFCPKNHKPVHVEQIIDWKGAVGYLQKKVDSGLEKLFEYGECPDKIADGSEATRTDLVEARKMILECDTFQDVLNHEDPNVIRAVASHFPWARSVFNAKKKKTGVTIEKFHDWQTEILELIKSDVDDRKIYWYYDPIGGTGKTTFASYLSDEFDAQCLAGKHQDMAHAWQEKKIAVFDLSRTLDSQYFSYGAIEDIKNGRIFSGKYDSCSKTFPKPHVLVFSNQLPLKGKWSEDRYVVKQIFSNGDSVDVPYEELKTSAEKRKADSIEENVTDENGASMSVSYASNPANFRQTKKRKTNKDE